MKTLLSKDIDKAAQLSVSLNSDGDLVAALVIKSDNILKFVGDKIPGGVDDALFALIKAQLIKTGSQNG